jgi:P-type E1-E2 ATPase
MAQCGQQMPNETKLFGDGDHDTAAETLLGWGGRVRGRFVIRESVRPEAERAIGLLRAARLHCVMLTGDRQPRAGVLAAALGLDYQAGLVPEAKLAAIRKLQAAGPVVMVGDGINDAPALAASDAGIALGCGTDISQHTASICLLTSDLARVPWLVHLARRTERTIHWNLIWTFAYNIGGIGLAAAGWLHPVIAAIAMGASSLLVITNSLALARFDCASAAGEARS